MEPSKEEQNFSTHLEKHSEQGESITAQETPPAASHDPVSYWTWQFIVLFLSVSLSFYAGFLGTSPGWNLLRTTVATHFASSGAVAWSIPTIYFCQSLSSFLFGRLSDLVGRRWILLSGSLTSFIGFLVAGRASTGSTLVGGNALIGIGTGIQLMAPWLVLAELVPVNHRFTVTGLSMALFAPLLAMFPAIAEVLSEKTTDSWRWCYSFNAILTFVSLVGLYITYHPPTYQQVHENLAARDELHKKDWIGLAIMSLSAGILTYALLWGRTVFAWRSAQVITVITISGLVLVLYLTYQYFRGHDHAALPGYLIQNWSILSQIALASSTSLLLWFYQLAAAIVFQSIFAETGMRAAWDCTSWSAGLTGGILAATVALIRPKHVKWQLVAGTVLCMAFLAAQPSVSPKRHAATLAFFVLTGFGQGYTMVISYVTAPLVAHNRDLGLVTGLVAGFRSLVFAVFLAGFGAIYTPRFQSRSAEFVAKAALEAGLPESSLPAFFQALTAAEVTGDAAALFSVPGVTFQVIGAASQATIKAGANAYKFVLEIGLVYVFPTILLSLLAPDTDTYMSSEIAARLNPPSLVARHNVLGRKRQQEHILSTSRA